MKKLGVRRVLEQVPDPPWALYITKTYKKHGWISTHVNLSHECFALTIDDEEFLLTRQQLTDLISKTRDAAGYVGRWSWLQGTIVVDDEGKLALEKSELYAWWLTHRYDSLIRSLVDIMVPTKKELKEQAQVSPSNHRGNREEPQQRPRRPSTLDSFLGVK